MCRVRLRRAVDGGRQWFFLGVGGIGMGREGAAAHGVRIVFHSMSALQTALISILYKQSVQWWFHCMRLQECVGSVCVGGTELMCRGRECVRLGSATRHISFYTPLVGGGLRLSCPSSGSNGSVRVYGRVIFGKQNWRCTRTLYS